MAKKSRRKSDSKKSLTKRQLSKVDQQIDAFIERNGRFPSQSTITRFEASARRKGTSKKRVRRDNRGVSQTSQREFSQRTITKNLTSLTVVQRMIRFTRHVLIRNNSNLSRVKTRLLRKLLPHTEKFFLDFDGKHTNDFQYIILTSFYTNVRGEPNAQGVSGIRTEILSKEGNRRYTESIIDFLIGQSETYLSRFVKQIRIQGLRMEVVK